MNFGIQYRSDLDPKVRRSRRQATWKSGAEGRRTTPSLVTRAGGSSAASNSKPSPSTNPQHSGNTGRASPRNPPTPVPATQRPRGREDKEELGNLPWWDKNNWYVRETQQYPNKPVPSIPLAPGFGPHPAFLPEPQSSPGNMRPVTWDLETW